MKCPKCQHENPADTQYCGKCGNNPYSSPFRKGKDIYFSPSDERGNKGGIGILFYN
jgi:hypothetical protein